MIGCPFGLRGEVRLEPRHDIIVVPYFVKERPQSGGDLSKTMTMAMEYLQDSAMHFEIVGDGFGDFSFKMADAACRTARRLGIPMVIFDKQGRKSRDPSYAEDFLILQTERGSKILNYRNEDELASNVLKELGAEYLDYLRRSDG
jgi:hypothetical protein